MSDLIVIVLLLAAASIVNTAGLSLLLWRQRMLAKALLSVLKREA